METTARDAVPYLVTDPVPEDATERQKYYSDLEKTLGSIVDNPDPAARQRVRDFLDGLMQIDMFDSSAYANLLVGAARSTSGMSKFSNDLPNAAPSRSTSFGGVSCENWIYKLAAASLAQAIATNADTFGFSQLAKKDVAEDWRQQMIMEIMPNLMVDHIDSALAARSRPTISDIRQNNPQLVQDFMAHALKPTFVHVLMMHDQQTESKDYMLHVLLTFEFFRQGPGLKMSKTADPSQEVAAATGHWTQVVQKTLDVAKGPEFQRVRPGSGLDSHARSASSILAVNGRPSEALPAVSDEVKKHLTQRGDPWQATNAGSKFQSLGWQMWQAWELTQPYFLTAVQNATNRSRTQDGPTTVDVGVFNAATDTATEVHRVQEEIVFGDDIASFVSDNRELFSGTVDDNARMRAGKVRIVDVRSTGSACFSSGTRILTPNGSVNIEKLQENTEILTRGGDHPQVGICSDESVKTPTAIESTGERCMLYGFNGESEFFTAGHVFHTTTGLRAVNPFLAVRENPWLEVGRLKPGHSVLHTSDGRVYQPELIKSLNCRKASCEYVYGVHLREGLRSYHANGYLVHLNYPEITIKSISKLLLSVDSSQRIAILRSAKELDPLFQRFGIATVSQALEQEIHAATKSERNRLFTSKKGTNPLQGVRHIKRSFALTDDVNGEMPVFEHSLDDLNVYEGVLSTGTNYCPRADLSGRQVTWTRQVSAEQWEHGFCKFNSMMSRGHGVIVYGAEHLKSDGSDAQVSRPILATAKTRAAKPAEATTTANRVQADGPWLTGTRQLPQASNPVAQRVAASHTANGDVGAPQEKVAMINSATDGNDANSGDSNEFIQLEPHEPIDVWSLSYDTEEWDDKRQTPANTAPYLDVYTAVSQGTGDFIAQISILDDLANHVAANTQMKYGPLKQMGQLYWTWLEEESDGTLNLYFQIRHPDLVATAADNYDSSKAQFHDLKFTFADKMIELPFIFSEMRVTINSDGDSASGIVREFDHTTVGNVGKRHLLIGNAQASADSAEFRNAVSSSTIGTAPGSDVNNMRVSHLGPSPGTMRLAQVASAVPNAEDAKAKDLAHLKHNGKTLHEKSQRLIEFALQYHMTDDQRNNFANTNKPSEGNGSQDIPFALASNLDPKLQEWLKNTYIKGWIAKRIADMPAINRKSWRTDFTDQQRKKISYWFTGKGDNTISSSKEYTLVNGIAATEAMKAMHPELADVMNDTEEDDEKRTGGEKWAAKVYKIATTNDNLQNMAQSTDAIDNNKLQFFGNLFHVLDPTSRAVTQKDGTTATRTYAQRLSDKVQEFRVAKLGMSTRFLGLYSDKDTDQEYMWLDDALKAVVEDVSSDKKTLSGAFADELQANVESMSVALGIDIAQSAAARAAQFAQMMSQLTRKVAQLVKGAQQFRSWKRGPALAHEVSEAAITGTMGPSNFKKAMMYAAPVFTLIQSALFAFAAFNAYGVWSDTPEADKATLVMSTVQATVQLFSDMLGPFKKIFDYRAAKNGVKPENIPDELKGAEASDSEIEMTSNSIDETWQSKARISEPEPSASVNEFDSFSEANVTANIEEVEAMANQTQRDLSIIRNADPPAEGPEISLAADDAAKASGATETKMTKTFSMIGRWAKVALIGLGLAIAVATCVSLAREYDNMDNVEKGINVTNTVITGLSPFISMYELYQEIGEDAAKAAAQASAETAGQAGGQVAGEVAADAAASSAGEAAAAVAADAAAATAAESGLALAGCMSSFLAVAGPLLAVAGIVLMFVLMAHHHQEDPPPSAPEQWINNTGSKFADELPEPPAPLLAWTVTDTLHSGQTEMLLVTGTNTSNADVAMSIASASFTSGKPGAVFVQGEFKKTQDKTRPSVTASQGWVGLTDADSIVNAQIGIAHTNTQPTDDDKNPIMTWAMAITPIPKPKPKPATTDGTASKSSSNTNAKPASSGLGATTTTTRTTTSDPQPAPEPAPEPPAQFVVPAGASLKFYAIGTVGNSSGDPADDMGIAISVQEAGFKDGKSYSGYLRPFYVRKV